MNPLHEQIRELDDLLREAQEGHPPKLWDHYTTLDGVEKEAFILAMVGKVLDLNARMGRQR